MTRRSLRTLYLVSAVVAAAALAGCLGRVDDVPPPADSLDPGSDSVVAAARVPMRRLTAVEYDYSVLDLLGDDVGSEGLFTADDAPAGYASNSSSAIGLGAVEATLEVAERVALRSADRLAERAGCDADEVSCRDRVIERLGRRAFRRPLASEEVAALVRLYEDERTRSVPALSRAVLVQAMLASPSFLYRPEVGAPPGASGARALGGYELATRLSFALWSSLPDDELLDAAASGELATAEGIARQAERLLADARFERSVRSFHRQWLDLDRLATKDKDPARFPELTSEIRAAMEEESLAFTVAAVQQGPSGLTALLTSPRAVLPEPLAAFYGAAGAGERDLSAIGRAGILTHGSVMTVHSDADQSSPILRGKLVRTSVLCGTIAPPPPGLVVVPPRVDPARSTRERFAMHTADPTCAACHSLMDPIGFGFEHFDAVGRYREREGEHAIDARGEVQHSEATDGAFDGAGELAALLARSPEVHRCYGRQWLRYVLGRGENAREQSVVDRLAGELASSDLDIRALVLALVTSDAFRFTRGEGE